MATYRKRKNKDNSISHTATIRLKVNGLSHSETKTLKNKKILQTWVARRESKLREPGAIEKITHKGTTIGHVLAWYLEDFQGVSKFGRTKLSHINYLSNQNDFTSLDVVNLTSADLTRYASNRTASAFTVNNDLVWLRNAMRARGIPMNLPALEDAVILLWSERVIGKAKKRTRRPTRDELDKLLTYFKSRDKRSKVKMVDVVLFAMFSARRQEEICSIRWEDLDERRKGVVVRDMKHPREKVDTFCSLPDRAWDIIEQQERKDAIIFPYNSKTVSAAFTRACSFLEIEDLRFHDLRHEGVSLLFELGWDIPKVSSVSGHKSWATLQRYTHLREYDVFDKYKGWNWI